jgi:SsrA-binding protein
MSGQKGSGDGGTRLVTENRRARFDFAVDETLEAGLALLGSEVKSLREGTASLSDSYVLPNKAGEMFLHNAHIGPFKPASVFAHEPLRTRKLLMHREEAARWGAKVRERGYAIIPLSLYFKKGRAKVQLGLARGKNHEDRRQTIKERETKREMDREIRRR